ncbi:MAG TPA: FixH family protein [Casimicrobiaceae bacterium]|nr:FixH family protein [Casimicrobiaceae bacterium]
MTALAIPVSSPPRAPWYRQRWPWLLMLGPGIVVVAGFVTLWIAFRSDDGLVADDYYARGLAINQTLDRAARAAQLGLAARVHMEPNGRASIALEGRGPLPPIIRLRLVHPTRAGLDETGELKLGPDGRYAGQLPPVGGGRRLVVVEALDWRLGPVETRGDALDVTLASAVH